MLSFLDKLLGQNVRLMKLAKIYFKSLGFPLSLDCVIGLQLASNVFLLNLRSYVLDLYL